MVYRYLYFSFYFEIKKMSVNCIIPLGLQSYSRVQNRIGDANKWGLEKQLKGWNKGVQCKQAKFCLQRNAHSQFIPSRGEQHDGRSREQTTELM